MAIVISAMIGLMAFRSFDGAADAAEETQKALNEVGQIDKLWQTMSNDLFHVLPLDQNTPFQGASLKSSGASASQMLLLFKRGNWVNFANRLRSDIQLVAYRLDQGKLYRDFLPETNRPLSEIDMERQAFHQLLIDGVEDVQLRFLYEGMISSRGVSALQGYNYSDDWLPEWPDPVVQGAAGIPLALEVRITLKGGEPSVRLFTFP